MTEIAIFKGLSVFGLFSEFFSMGKGALIAECSKAVESIIFVMPDSTRHHELIETAELALKILAPLDFT